MQKLGIMVVAIALIGLALVLFLHAGCKNDCETAYSFDEARKQSCMAKCSENS